MKTLVLTTAIALGFAAPSFANDQLAAQLGVDAGAYSLSELVLLKDAIENNDEDRINFILNGSPANAVDPQAVTEFQARTAAEDDDAVQARFFAQGGSEVISTQSFGASEVARAFAIEQAYADDNVILARFLENGGSLN